MPQYGTRGSSYTPSFSQGMGHLVGAMKDRRAQALEKQKNELAQATWMGDPEAAAQLQAMDPQLAMQVENQAMQRKARTTQEEMAGRSMDVREQQLGMQQESLGMRKDAAFNDEFKNVLNAIGKFDDFESAKSYAEQQIANMMQKYPDQMPQTGIDSEFTAQDFAEIQTVMGGKPAKRTSKVVKGVLVDDVTGEVIYQPEEGESISDRKTIMIDTAEGQKMVDASTGEEIKAFGPKPVKAVAPKEPSGEEKKAAGFLGRMVNAQSEITRLMGSKPDFDPTSGWETSRGAFNTTASPEFQQYAQAARDWIRAKLRKESGAVIGEDEAADEYETYFPIYGDSAEVIAQKARSRKQAEKQMQTSASRAWKEPEGQAWTKDNPASPTNKEEFDKLAPGSYFKTPSGELRRK